ncbi:hypothetical protein FG386_001466 [Cryptosporidium ryanae]|uniref:uncharacterized protein n=1 Tax=Cryptosporidium ryanae TaxID=515981 RepID=UPI00351A869B|nr:hypothetical protein FG386_001466 [Cryptosporidium ryanae]
MRKLYIIGIGLTLIYVFVALSLLNTITIVSAYSPNYREIKVVRRNIPTRPVPSRYRGELLTNGDILWYKNIRMRSGNWSGWRPVSVNQVPTNLVKQMAARVSKIRHKSPVGSRMEIRRVVGSPGGFAQGTATLPLEQEEFETEIPSDQQLELPSPQIQKGQEYSWVELPSESSPLTIIPMEKQQGSQTREYNYQVAQARKVPGIRKQVPYQQVSTRSMQIARPEKQLYGMQETEADKNDMAMYFEDKQIPSLESITGKSVPGGVFSKLAQGLKSLTPHNIPTPAIEFPQKGGFRGGIPSVSEYDLTRMQWKFFIGMYNPRLDNVRVIRKTPPLGLKLSKTVSECRRNMYNSFISQYISVSGINYSKKLKREMILSVVREIKQWCNGMMTNWYHQLQQMGYRVPTTKEFMR